MPEEDIMVVALINKPAADGGIGDIAARLALLPRDEFPTMWADVPGETHEPLSTEDAAKVQGAVYDFLGKKDLNPPPFEIAIFNMTAEGQYALLSGGVADAYDPGFHPDEPGIYR